MERKDYKLEIVYALLKGPNHVRGLAHEFGGTPMMASRKLRELLDANVVDYRPEGKNKVYSLKNTLEARTFIFVAEHYRLLQTLNLYPRLRKLIQAIQNNPEIKLALLFGSYAKGLANQGSDIDLFVETTEEDLKGELELLDSRLSVKIGRYDPSNLVIKEIEKNHVVIKGVEVFYEKNRFFG